MENTYSLVNDDEVSELSLEDEFEEEDCEDEFEDIFKTKIIENQFLKFLLFKASNDYKIKYCIFYKRLFY